MAQLDPAQMLRKMVDYLIPVLTNSQKADLMKIMESDADEESDTKPDPIAEDAAYKKNFPHADRLKPGTRSGVCPPTVRTSPIVVDKAASAEMFPDAHRLKA